MVSVQRQVKGTRWWCIFEGVNRSNIFSPAARRGHVCAGGSRCALPGSDCPCTASHFQIGAGRMRWCMAMASNTLCPAAQRGHVCSDSNKCALPGSDYPCMAFILWRGWRKHTILAHVCVDECFMPCSADWGPHWVLNSGQEVASWQ